MDREVTYRGDCYLVVILLPFTESQVAAMTVAMGITIEYWITLLERVILFPMNIAPFLLI